MSTLSTPPLLFPIFTRVKTSGGDESDSPFDSLFHAEQIRNIPLLIDHDPRPDPVTGLFPGDRRLP